MECSLFDHVDISRPFDDSKAFYLYFFVVLFIREKKKICLLVCECRCFLILESNIIYNRKCLAVAFNAHIINQPFASLPHLIHQCSIYLLIFTKRHWSFFYIYIGKWYWSNLEIQYEHQLSLISSGCSSPPLMKNDPLTSGEFGCSLALHYSCALHFIKPRE